jgi:hypothetical protein
VVYLQSRQRRNDSDPFSLLSTPLFPVNDEMTLTPFPPLFPPDPFSPYPPTFFPIEIPFCRKIQACAWGGRQT